VFLKLGSHGVCVKRRNRDAYAHVAMHDTTENTMETYDPKKSTAEVTQANPRKMNFRVLLFSMIGIVLLFAIIYLVFTMAQPNPT
jgi:hypothetical protein